MGVCASAPEDLSASSQSRFDQGSRSRRGHHSSDGRADHHHRSVEAATASSLVSPTGLPETAPHFSTPPYDPNCLSPHYNNASSAARMNAYHQMSTHMYNSNNYKSYEDISYNGNSGLASDSAAPANPYSRQTTEDEHTPDLSPPPATAQLSNGTPVPLNIAVNQHTNNKLYSNNGADLALPRVPPPPPPPRPSMHDVIGDDDMSTTAMSLDNYSCFDSTQASPARQLGSREGSSISHSHHASDGVSGCSEYSMQNYIVEMLYNKEKKGSAFAASSGASASASGSNHAGYNSQNANTPMASAAAAAHKGGRPSSDTASQSSTALSIDDNFVNLCKKENLNDVNISQLNDELHMKLVASGLARNGPYKYASINTNNRTSTVGTTAGASDTGFMRGDGNLPSQPVPAMRRRAVSFLGEMRT